MPALAGAFSLFFGLVAQRVGSATVLINLGEHRVCLFAAAKPRKSMRANKIWFHTRSDVDGRFRESIGQGQIRQPDGAVSCPDEQVRVGCDVGVETQRCPPHYDLDVVTLIGPGEFGGDQPAQAPQLRGWRAAAAHLAVERMRHPHLHTSNAGLERDQTAGVGLLDRGRIGDPPQRRQFDRFPNSQRVDHIINRGG